MPTEHWFCAALSKNILIILLSAQRTPQRASAERDEMRLCCYQVRKWRLLPTGLTAGQTAGTVVPQVIFSFLSSAETASSTDEGEKIDRRS